MRVLFLSSWFPYPSDTGGKIRILHLVKCLSASHQLTFLAFSRSGRVSTERLEAMQSYCDVLEPVVLPRPKPVVGQLLPNPRWHSSEMRTKIRAALSANAFDLVIAAEVLAGFYGAEIHGIPRILDNCELTVLIERCTREPQTLKRLRYRHEWWSKRHFTATLVRRYDACTVVSTHERDHLLSLVPDKERVWIVPNGVDVRAHSMDWGTPEPYTLVYPGALTYHANLDAMAFFLQAIFPLLRHRYPQVRLRITGDTHGVNLDRVLRGAASGVILTGYLQDIRPCVAQSAVCIVPLRIGGGTRLKILEAMALGTPVVSTPKGAEGLHVTPGEDILLANSPREFADAVSLVLENEVLRHKITANARRLIAEEYDWRRCVRPLEALMERIAR